MKKSPLVSIIMPTHNRSVFLLEAVDSVLNQSYTNWELIIIADACTDNTNELIKPYLQDNRVSFKETEENLGGAGARNLGLDMAKGEYISFLDDDDIWHQNKIQVQLVFLQKKPETMLVYCNFNQWIDTVDRKEIRMKSSISLNELLILNSIGSFSFVMVAASALKQTRIDEKLRSAQDWDLWTKVLRNTNTLAQNCNLILVDYRMQGQEKISVNKKSVSNGYERWLKNNEQDMNASLKAFHNTIIQIKKENSLFKCVKFGLNFFLKNPTKVYLNIVISKVLYSQLYR